MPAPRVASTDIIVYTHLYRTGTIARNTDHEKKRKAIRDKMTILEGFAALRPQVKDDRWFRGMSSQIALSIFDIVGRFFYPERKEYIRALKRQVSFPLSTYHATKSSKRKILLANVSPYLICRLYHRK